MSFQSRLAKLGTNWKKAANRDVKQFGNELEDGRYICRITDCELQESMSSNRLQVMWEHTVVEGPESNATIRSYDGIETEDGLFYLQRKIAKLGKQIPDDPKGLETLLVQIAKEKPIVRIRVKTKGEFQNVYLDRLIGEQPADEVGSGASAGAGDDPPEEPGDEGSETTTASLSVGGSVTVLVKGEELEVTVSKIVDDETFKAKDAKGKEKAYTVEHLVKKPEGAEEAGAGEMSLDVGDKIRVKTAKGELTVEITKIIDEETLKAKGKDGKEKTFTTDMIVL